MNFILELTPNLNEKINNILKEKEEFIQVSEHTPEILVKVGLPDKPIYFPRDKIVLGLLSGDSTNHGHKDEIGKKTIKKALPHLGDPLAISTTEENAFGVYLNDKASTGKPLYIYIRYDTIKDCNVIISIYGRISTDSEKFVYIDDTKFRQKWDTKSWLVKKFKNKLEDEIFKESCYTKTKLKKNSRL